MLTNLSKTRLTCIALGGVLAAGCTTTMDDASDQARIISVSVPTPAGDDVRVDLRVAEWTDNSIEATATVEGFDYTLSVANYSKRSLSFVGSKQDPTVWLDASRTDDVVELELVAGDESWYSTNGLETDFQQVAVGEPHVRRMFLALQSLQMAPTVAAKCPWCGFVAAVGVYVAACLSESRWRPLVLECTGGSIPETEGGTTTDCRMVPDTNAACEVKGCDKCLGPCYQNC